MNRGLIMQVTELHRQQNQDGQTIVEYKADKLVVRLITTYDKKKSLDEVIYMMACRKLAGKLAS